MRPPEALHRLGGVPAGLNQVMDALLLIFGRTVGVVGLTRTARVRKHQYALVAVLEGLHVGRVRRLAPLLIHQMQVPMLVGQRDHAGGSAGDLGHIVHTEGAVQHIQRIVGDGQSLDLGDQIVPHGYSLLRDHGISVRILDLAGTLVPVLVHILLVVGNGKGVHEVVDQDVTRREIQLLQIRVGLLGGGLGAVLLGLVGVDDLKHAGMPCVQLSLNVLDHRGHGQSAEDLLIEALLAPVQTAQVPPACLAVLDRSGHHHSVLHVLHDDLPGVRHLVIHILLLAGELVAEGIVLHSVIGDGAGIVNTHRLHVTGDQLHTGGARLHELVQKSLTVAEGGALAPKPQPLGIGQLAHAGGGGGRYVDHAGLGQSALKLQPRQSLGRGLLLTPAPLFGNGVGHVVGLIEGDHTVEVLPQPRHDLVQIGSLVLGGLGGLRAEGGISGKQDPVTPGTLVRLAPLVEHYVSLVTADRRPVADSVLEQRRVVGDPYGTLAPLGQIVHDDTRDLPSLAHAGTVADQVALAGTVREGLLVRLSGIHDIHHLLPRPNAAVDGILGQMGLVGGLGSLHRGHSRRLHQYGRVRLQALHGQGRGHVVGINAGVLGLLLGSPRLVVLGGSRSGLGSGSGYVLSSGIPPSLIHAS